MVYEIKVTEEQLIQAVAQLITDVDYDISKEYDPTYEGRESAEHDTYEDVARQLLLDVIIQGGQVALVP